MNELTPISSFDGWYAKREDKACFVSDEHPSGSKVRQYMGMSKKFPGAPMIVGCASESAMQVYVASSAKLCGVKGIIYVPKKKELTESTKYAIAMGAEINFTKVGYMNVLRSAARERAKQIGTVVRWDAQLAISDILAFMANNKIIATKVVAIGVSTMSDKASIIEQAKKIAEQGCEIPDFDFIQHPLKYQNPLYAELPDGTVLDPYYAAKCFSYITAGDLLWITGVRPISAMPKSIFK